MKFKKSRCAVISSLDTISSDSDQKRKDKIRSAKHAFEYGACDYLVKPISQEVLNEIWQHVLRRRLRNKDELVVCRRE